MLKISCAAGYWHKIKCKATEANQDEILSLTVVRIRLLSILMSRCWYLHSIDSYHAFYNADGSVCVLLLESTADEKRNIGKISLDQQIKTDLYAKHSYM